MPSRRYCRSGKDDDAFASRAGTARAVMGANASLRIVGAQTNGVIQGTTSPHAEIDACNLSASAAEPTGFHDTVTIARADARGRFAGTLPMRQGDVVRVRARGKRGKVGRWLVFRADGLGGISRPLAVAVFRIGLRDLGTGNIRVFNLSTARPIAHPGAELAIVNTRTGDRIDLVLNDRGSFGGALRIRGRGGDDLRIETMTDPPKVLGTLVTPTTTSGRVRTNDDRVAPCGHHQRLGSVPDVKPFDAPLFAGQPRAQDVFQSELPNCYVASAAAAMAHARPEVLERSIVQIGEHRFRVRFRTLEPATRRAIAHDVEVNADLYVRPSGGLLYGSTNARALDRDVVLWWPILEKAFARFKGSYKSLGDGGCADLVLQALLGRPARRFFVDGKKDGEADRVWGEIDRAFGLRLPVVAGTSSYSPRKYRNTGLVPNHAYSVLSCREIRGSRLVGVRNPWGEDASLPCRPRRNGYLELDITEFTRLFCVVGTVR